MSGDGREDPNLGLKIGGLLVLLTLVAMAPRWAWRAARSSRERVLGEGFGSSGTPSPSPRRAGNRSRISVEEEPSRSPPRLVAAPLPDFEDAPAADAAARRSPPGGRRDATFERMSGLHDAGAGSAASLPEGREAAPRTREEALRREVSRALERSLSRAGGGPYASRPARVEPRTGAYAAGDERSSGAPAARAVPSAEPGSPAGAPVRTRPKEDEAAGGRSSAAGPASTAAGGFGGASSGGGGGGSGGGGGAGGGGSGSGEKKKEKKKEKKPGAEERSGDEEGKKEEEKRREEERKAGDPERRSAQAASKESLDGVGASLRDMDRSLADLGGQAEKVAEAGGRLAAGDDWQKRLAEPVGQAADKAGDWADTAGTALSNFSDAHLALFEARADLEEARALFDQGAAGIERRVAETRSSGTPPPPSPETERALEKAESRLMTAEGRLSVAQDSIGAGQLVLSPQAEPPRPSISEERAVAAGLVADLAARQPQLAGPQSRGALTGLDATERKLGAAAARADAAVKSLKNASSAVERSRAELAAALEEARAVRAELDRLRAEPPEDPEAKAAELKARLAQARARAHGALRSAAP